MTTDVRYRFGDFVLSPRRRVLARAGVALPLIPRYFDLLVFLIQHRREAVHRRDIFDRVWSDVMVSDSALSQAIRTLRRTLGEDPREPRFIRTVSRHGYQFVFADLVEEADEDWPPPGSTPVPAAVAEPERPVPDPFEPLLQRLTASGSADGDEEDRREAAELLHGLGTTEALKRLGTRPGHALARAMLRDARWDLPGAGDVPILGAPAPIAVFRALIASRWRRAARSVGSRSTAAGLGSSLAGVVAGITGGLLLAAAPNSGAPLAVVPVLAAIGGLAGMAGGAGVGAGLSLAEAAMRSRRRPTLILGAAAGGALAGATAQWLSRWTLEALFGLRLPIGGSFEGLVLGAAAGLGYALATGDATEGLATPRGHRRLAAALLTAALTGIGALGLTVAGHPLVGGTLHMISDHARGSRLTLLPLAQLIGEPVFGPLSQALLGTIEGLFFGAGVTLGLTHRHTSRRSHKSVTPS